MQIDWASDSRETAQTPEQTGKNQGNFLAPKSSMFLKSDLLFLYISPMYT